MCMWGLTSKNNEEVQNKHALLVHGGGHEGHSGTIVRFGAG